MIKPALILTQSIVIIFFLFRVLALSENFKFIQVIFEVCLTISAYIFSGRKSNISYNLIASTSLCYLCLPSFTGKIRLVGIIYLIKYFHLRTNLKILSEYFAISQWIPYKKYHNFVFDFLRYSVLEYLFLGFMIMNYKIFTMNDPEDIPLPEDYQLYYQFMVTTTTIGYGDVCPKSRLQMIYFALAIPTICGSFVIYLNHVSEVFSNCFLSQSTTSSETDLEKILKEIVSGKELENLKQYIALKKAKRESDKNFESVLETQGLAQQQTLITTYRFSKFKQFIKMLYPSATDRRTQQIFAQLIEEKFYPKGAVILNDFEINTSVIYCSQGSLQASSGLDASKQLINVPGFNDGTPSNEKYTAGSFVVIWSLDSKAVKTKFHDSFQVKLQK